MAQTQLEKYFYETRSPVYAVLFVVPLFLIYEILALTLHKLQITHLRNGADVMMRNLVSLFGLDNFPFIVLLILGALAVTAGYYKKKHQMQKIKERKKENKKQKTYIYIHETKIK